jgi:hypothetical protein
MTLEDRVEKLEKRRSRADKRPLHIAYIALVIGFASGAIGVVNAMAVNEMTVRVSKWEAPPKAEPPRKSILSDRDKSPWVKGTVCGRDGAKTWCR